MKLVYAAVSADGQVVGVENTIDRAVGLASRHADQVQVEIMPPASSPLGDLGDLEDLELAPPEDHPAKAFSLCGLPRISMGDVMALSVEQAHGVLRPYFPTSRIKSGRSVRIKAYETPTGMADVLMGQNYKTAKGTPEQPSEVQGLSLLPQKMALDLTQQTLSMRNLCVGASPACIAACLVYSGRNEADIYNRQVKLARVEALMAAPVAFVRMLVASIDRLLRRADETGDQPFVRLNVFSDVPWELVCPGLFEHYHSLQFYDYTKVAGRAPPANYDLTFSYSGKNLPYVNYELGRSRRVAVVYLHPPGLPMWRGPGKSGKNRPISYGLPTSTNGLRVVDGDLSDVRPRDPSPSIVGLRWKPPKPAKLSPEERIKRLKKSLPLAVETTRSAYVVEAREFHGHLIVTESGRMTPIDDVDQSYQEAAEEE